MAPSPSTTSYALLGLLSLRDWTTYELAQQVKRSLNWFWPRAERKLYDEPKRLVELGLATAVKGHTGRRARTVYSVTDAGRASLAAWLDEPSAPRSGEFEAMIKVFFADSGTRDQLLATLARIEQEAADRLATLAQFATSEMPFPKRIHLRALGLTLQHEQEEAIARWAAWAREQVLQWQEADDPGDWDAAGRLQALSEGESPVSASNAGLA